MCGLRGAIQREGAGAKGAFEMKLWLLVIKKETPGYMDIMARCVVRAKNEQKARELASKVAMDEGLETWIDPTFSSCEQLTAAGKEKIIIQDRTPR
jgi:hypothetical protein